MSGIFVRGWNFKRKRFWHMKLGRFTLKTSWHASPIGTCTQIPKITWYKVVILGNNFLRFPIFLRFLGAGSSPKFWAQLDSITSIPIPSIAPDWLPGVAIWPTSNIQDPRTKRWRIFWTKEPHFFFREKKLPKAHQIKTWAKNLFARKDDHRITHRKHVKSMHLFEEMIEILKFFRPSMCLNSKFPAKNIPHLSLFVVRRKVHEKAKRFLQSHEPPVSSWVWIPCCPFLSWIYKVCLWEHPQVLPWIFKESGFQ